MRAVIYTRVSSEQQIGNTSLDEQEKVCREYGARNHLEIVELFREEGESAKFVERTKLQQALKYCNNRKNDISVFIVYKYDRFSRNLENHLFIKAILSARGIRLVSATEPVDESPSGRLQENILAAFAQFDNEVRTERTIAGIRSKLSQGAWYFVLPPGYIRENGQIIEHPQWYSIVKRAWQLALTGNYMLKDLKDFLSKNQVITVHGNPLTISSVSRLFRNPFYAGLVTSKKLNIKTIGHHKPMISESQFYLVQKILYSKKGYLIVNHLRQNPVFYLNRLVKCEHCGSYLTGSYSKKKYGYYRCRNYKCESRTQIKKETLEILFMDLLQQHSFKPQHAKLINEAITARYQDKTGWREHEIDIQESNLNKIKNAIKKAHLMRLREQVSEDEYNELVQDLKADQAALELELSRLKMVNYEAVTIINMAVEYLQHLPKYWISLSSRSKYRLAKLIFPSGVNYNNSTLATLEISPLFVALGKLNSANLQQVTSLLPFCNSLIKLFKTLDTCITSQQQSVDPALAL